MSYYLYHDLSVTDITTQKDADRIASRLEEAGFEDLSIYDNCEVYSGDKTTYEVDAGIYEGHIDVDKILVSLSRQTIGALFIDTVTDHEEIGGMWRTYIKNGKSVSVLPEIIWPEFDDDMLNKEQELPF